MKVIFYLILFILPVCSSAQFFVPNGSKWYSSGYDVFSGQPGNPISCNYDWQTEIVGDTIYGGNTLQIVFHEKFSQCSDTPNPGYGAYSGYLMLDSNRVFFGTEIDSLVLVYDFNLNIGDTVIQPVYFLMGPEVDTVIVTSIDSVSYGGVVRKRISFEDFELPYNNTATGMQWVEGIGDIHYGFNPINNYSFHPNIYLDCFISGQETLIGQCYLEAEEMQKNEVEITTYPNPFTDHITIQTGSEDVSDVKILDMNGKIVFQENGVQSGTQLNLPDLETGIYLLHICTNSITKTERIVKTY